MNQNVNIVAFTGHRTYTGAANDELRQTIEALYERGARTFRVGMAEGFDLCAAEIVTELKHTHTDIILEACIPWPDFPMRFTRSDRERYDRIITSVSIIRYASSRYSVDVFHRRNDMLVDGCDTVVAWWKGHSSGTGYTVRRARRHGCHVINLFSRELFTLSL